MNRDRKTQEFKGFYVPNSTPVPDNFFDELLVDLSESELKVVLYIMRRTFGFKKHDDNISISQMLNGIVKKDGTRLDRGTGLSKPAITKAVKSLVNRGVLVTERRFGEKGSYESSNYHLNLIEIPPSKNSLQGGLVNNLNKGVVKNFNKPLVKIINIQDTVIQDTENNVNVNAASKKVEKTDLRRLPDIDQPKEKTKYVADEISTQLVGDNHSKGFHYLVAAKIPERVIRQFLAEIKQSNNIVTQGAVFTDRVKTYAAEAISKQRLSSVYSSADLAEKMQLR